MLLQTFGSKTWKMNNYNSEDLSRALETLRKGGLILYPTDTVWGLGCDATNPKAVEKLRKLKGRSSDKALLCVIGSDDILESYADGVPDVAYELIDTAVESLTIVYDKGIGFAPGVCGADGSVGIRIINSGFTGELLRRFGKPVISTSANLAGEITPANFSQISEELKEKVDYVVQMGRDDTSEHLPSHILRLRSDGEVSIIR